MKRVCALSVNEDPSIKNVKMSIDLRKKLILFAVCVCAATAGGGCRRSGLKVAHMVEPVYPVIARSKNIQGTVELGITIGMDGKVSDAVGSGADPILVEAAKENALQWTWGPFPPRFHFPYYQEIQYVYELRGDPKAFVVPPMVNTDLPNRIEIIATRY